MGYLDIYKEWLNNDYFDDAFREELKNLPEDEIEERFFKDLEFGTAGLRGIVGAGRNRMNKYIIRKATQGYSNYLLSKQSENPTCVIAHDNRHFSDVFSIEAACVLAGNGIKTYLFKDMRSTPELSFTVRELATTGGIVVTASHNPKEYNGYKVYDNTGGQLIPVEADRLTQMVESVSDFRTIKYMDYEEAIEKNMIEYIDESMDDLYLDAVLKQRIHLDAYSQPMNMVYSPMHGVGGQIMPLLFDKLGLKDMYPHPIQMKKDPDFSSVHLPNPEEKGAFEKSMEYGKEVDAELLIGTDPDSDRMSIVVRNRDGDYIQLNGNEIGSLFTYYILSETKPLPKNPRIVKTIVTGDLPFAIAKDFGVEYEETLTGFKFIGDKINNYEKIGDSFILGYEEAIGFLIGTHARDKDGVVATMMAIEMAKYYKSKGKNLLEVLDEMYKKYGYYLAETVSVVYKGMEGMNIIKNLMDGFRANFKNVYSDLNAGDKIAKLTDYQLLQVENMKTGSISPLDADKSNVLKYVFDGGDWVCVRPSGTEPKIKYYYCVSAQTLEESESRLLELKSVMEKFSSKILENK